MKALNVLTGLTLLAFAAQIFAVGGSVDVATWTKRVEEIDHYAQPRLGSLELKKNWDLKREKLRAQGLPLLTNDLQAVATLQAWLAEAGLGKGALVPADSAEAAWLPGAQDGWPAQLLRAGLIVKRQGTKWYVDQVLRKSSAALSGWTRGALLDISSIHCSSTVCSVPRQLSASSKREQKTLSLKGVKPLSEALFLDSEASEQIRSISIPQVQKPIDVGYTRWLSASPAHGDELWRSLASRMEAKADVWLLDFRGGSQDDEADLARWFFFQEKSAKAATKPVYTKPLAILVDAGTSGTRERFALIAQAQNRAVIIGHETFGRPWPVTWAPMKTWSALLAWPAAFPEKPLSVTPDFQVPSDLSFAEGQDSALEATWLLMAQLDFEKKPSR